MSIPDVLSGREINWCPDGDGFHAFCPQPTDPDDYVYCCTYFYLGDDKPSCCRFPMHTGLLISAFLCAAVLFLLLLFLYCWCYPTSLLNRRRTPAGMTDEQHFIVEELNKEPFNLGVSIIDFDKFPDARILQILSDVICFIMIQTPVEIARENSEETAVRLLNALRILNFKPPTNPEEMELWRAGLIEGRKLSVYPVLHFILSNVDQLKERAYLARFLMKVEVPSELNDVDIEQLQHELAEMREQFKEIHFRVKTINEETMVLDEIRADLKAMENEKEALRNKIEKAERRVFNLPNLHRHMVSAGALRTQRERLAELEMKRQEERDQVIHLEQKLQRKRVQLEELVTIGENIDPSHMIAELQEEIATNHYFLNFKLIDDIEEKRAEVRELSTIYNMPAVDQKEINRLQRKIEEMSKKLIILEDRREEMGLNDNISVFRYQSAAMERRKQAMAQKLQEAKHELNRFIARIEAKKMEISTRSGVEVITGKEFREYATSVRDHSLLYKRYRRFMDEQISEREIVRSTMERIARKFEDLKEHIHEMGGDVVEDVEIRVAERPKTAAPRSNDVTELRNMVNGLMETVDRMKDAVEPLKREKEDKQSQFNELNEAVREKRNQFERRKEQLQRDSDQIREEVHELEEHKQQTIELIARLNDKMAQIEDSKAELEAGGEDFMQNLQEQLQTAEEEAEELRGRSGTEVDEEWARQQVIIFKDSINILEKKIEVLSHKNQWKY